MTDAQLLQIVNQLRELIDGGFDKAVEAQGATASVVRSLTSALRDADRNRQQDIDKFEQVKTAVLALIGHVQPRDFNKITAEELLDLVPIETIRGARDVHWARSKQQGLPLPPPPNVNIPQLIAQETTSGHVEIVPVMHAHRRKDDSITIGVGRDGKTRIKGEVNVKTLGGWILAIIAFLIFAWREIQHAYSDHGNQEQHDRYLPPPMQPSLPAPSIPVPQLAPPQVPPPTPHP